MHQKTPGVDGKLSTTQNPSSQLFSSLLEVMSEVSLISKFDNIFIIYLI